MAIQSVLNGVVYVYVGWDQPRMGAYDARTGRRLWRFRPDGTGFVSGDPVQVGTRIFLRSEGVAVTNRGVRATRGYLYSLDVRTGKQ